MNSMKMALLAGAALAVTAASANADDLEALKAQIDALNTRIAAMETAPSVPAGYQLIAVSEGELQATPGLGFTAKELAAYGNKSTIISVLPTADAPAGTSISWSGYTRAGLTHSSDSVEGSFDIENGFDGYNGPDYSEDFDGGEAEDTDVMARARLRVKASTDTAVGEVGVDLRLRGTFDGNGRADAQFDRAWGYWAMTPELTFGGGYYGSLGDIGYGYDGACSCYYTDNADLSFNPGDTTQMRLSYASGALSMAVALEDASVSKGSGNPDELGAAGELKYSGDSMNGEISAVWRANEENDADVEADWQVGAGIGFSLGDMASLSLAAAMGEGFYEAVSEGEIDDTYAIDNAWWGVTGLVSVSLSDEVHAELAGGYKSREGDNDVFDENVDLNYETYGVLAGIYYEPVDQLTVGIEGEWYTTDTHLDVVDTDGALAEAERETESYSIDFVSVWRF